MIKFVLHYSDRKSYTVSEMKTIFNPKITICQSNHGNETAYSSSVTAVTPRPSWSSCRHSMSRWMSSPPNISIQSVFVLTEDFGNLDID